MKKIKNHLKNKPSYLKWGNTRLAEKFNCSTEDISNIVKKLKKTKKEYIKSLNF